MVCVAAPSHSPSLPSRSSLLGLGSLSCAHSWSCVPWVLTLPPLLRAASSCLKILFFACHGMNEVGRPQAQGSRGSGFLWKASNRAFFFSPQGLGRGLPPQQEGPLGL